MEDIVETLKQANSAINDGILKLETYLKAKVDYLQILEQQLEIIETEKVADVEEVSEGHIITLDPVKMALEIPLILEIILGKLDFTSFLGSRLVAKYWDEAALNVFSKTPTKGKPSIGLNLEKLLKNTSDFNRIPELEPKLTKRIYFRGSCFCGEASDIEEDIIVCDCNTSKQKLLMFFEKFSAQIERIYFDVCARYTPTFLKAITNRCPNLKSLHLECENPAESPALEAELNEMEGMPHDELFRMNLNTIRFDNEFGHQPTSFYKKMQRIIDRAPNLARLKLVANYYPSLTNNKYLKHFCFYGGMDEPNFSQTKLSEMLDQVKDSLEVLEIFTQEEDSEGTNPQIFNFPRMNMLKKLVIWDITLHPLEQDGTTFIKTIDSKFPNLEHLEIENPVLNCVEMMFNKATRGPFIHLAKIQTVILDGIQNPSVFSLFNLWFPNLNKLEFAMPDDGNIEHLFSALRRLKLKHFSFSMEFYLKLSNLVKALVLNPELFKRLDILEIRANYDENPAIVDDLLFETRQSFCEWLRSTKGNIKSVTFQDFSFSGETALDVISVIRDHQLPIHFINTYE